MPGNSIVYQDLRLILDNTSCVFNLLSCQTYCRIRLFYLFIYFLGMKERLLVNLLEGSEEEEGELGKQEALVQYFVKVRVTISCNTVEFWW